MSISSNLTKLTTDITNAYTSIENKGGTIPSNKNTNNLSTAIDSIEVIEQATAEGESLSLANTKAMPYSDYVVKGKSEQEGEPSPSNPSEIHSVADDVNLFDYDTYKQYLNSLEIIKNGFKTTQYQNFIDKDIDFLEKGETYILSVDIKKYGTNQGTGASGTIAIRDITNSRNLGYYVNGSVFTIPNDSGILRFFIYGANPPDNNNYYEFTNIKLQKGTTSTPYSPYNQGTVTIKQRGKNLWNNNNVTSITIMTPNSNGGFKIQRVGNERISEEYPIYIPANTNVTISRILKNYTAESNMIYCQWITEDDTTIWTPNIYTDSLTTSFNKNIKGIKFYLQPTTGDGTYVEIEKLQVEIGSISTSYEPYQGYDKVLQTEPLRSLPNRVKDTIEADGIHRRVGRIVFDGTENWTSYTVLQNNIAQKGITLSPKAKSRIGYCNNFPVVADYSLTEHIVIAGGLTAVYIHIDQTRFSTQDLAGFKEWLSNNPVTLQYELETEIIEPLTQNQATTMLDIIKTGSYEGTTNIYTDEDVKPTIGVEYYKKG